MPVDIGEAIQEGIERTIARNGLYFVAITFVLDAVGALVSVEVTREMTVGSQFGAGPPVSNAPSIGLSPFVGGVLSLLVAIVSLVVVVAAIRTFVSEETETLREEHFSRNIVLALVNLVVGGVIFAVVVAIGLVLLIVPGLFLLVSLFFWEVYVIVEDENFIDGFRNSWALTGGHRLRLFAIGLIVVVINLIVGAIFGILPGSIGFLLAQVGSAITGVFTLATVARTYDQLVRLEDEGGASEEIGRDEAVEDDGFEFGNDD